MAFLRPLYVTFDLIGALLWELILKCSMPVDIEGHNRPYKFQFAFELSKFLTLALFGSLVTTDPPHCLLLLWNQQTAIRWS